MTDNGTPPPTLPELVTLAAARVRLEGTLGLHRLLARAELPLQAAQDWALGQVGRAQNAYYRALFAHELEADPDLEEPYRPSVVLQEAKLVDLPEPDWEAVEDPGLELAPEDAILRRAGLE